MLAVALSLAAAACWGVADFGGGLFSRRFAVPGVLLIIEAGGLVSALTIVALFAHSWPDGKTVLFGLLAGTSGMLGLALFYRGLAIGEMSVIAPISSTGAAVPVVFGLLTGDTLTTVIATGLAVAFAGIVLSGQEAAEGSARRTSIEGLPHALGAALGFGAFFVLYKSATDHSTVWPVLLIRLPAVPAMGALVYRQKIALPSGTDLRRLFALGQVDAVSGGFYAMAVTRGALSVVAVVGSLYPVITVLLARVILRERLRRVQLIGVVAAFTGVALISAGSA